MFPAKRERTGQSITDVDNKKDKKRGKRGDFLSNEGYLGANQGDNSAVRCFVLWDLIPMNFSKYVQITNLKIHTTGNFLVNFF